MARPAEAMGGPTRCPMSKVPDFRFIEIVAIVRNLTKVKGSANRYLVAKELCATAKRCGTPISMKTAFEYINAVVRDGAVTRVGPNLSVPDGDMIEGLLNEELQKLEENE